MATSDSPALVDTNVLVYALLPEVSGHAASRALFESAQSGSLNLCLAPQVLAEFYAVATDPRHITAPRDSAQALDAVRKYHEVPVVGEEENLGMLGKLGQDLQRRRGSDVVKVDEDVVQGNGHGIVRLRMVLERRDA